MRLKCIKLAGFKSFVDPTTVVFPSNLCAVVGPNGCGKSNIIDAVRWVMGESSVKNLRGESMSDVIFNGSGGRKPVGQATIELVFDNTDSTLGGEYASFNEISIRRSVARDGQSNYFLNGSKCRRRDITDVFLGTGLGPRSYSIIEQGMISNLIESRPEDLRAYIEEAAGVSKYKERRKDTEGRIRRTRENLERLTDIREELARQLQRLERQAKAAEKYTELKKEERLLRGQLLALRWDDVNRTLASKNKIVDEMALHTEALITEKRRCDTQLEKARASYAERSAQLNEIQGRFYAAGAEVARAEQTIKHARERAEELRQDLEQTQRNFAESAQHLHQDRAKAEGWQAELAEITAQLDQAKTAETASTEKLAAAEQAMRAWQTGWDTFNEKAAQPQREAEVQRSRIAQFESSLTALAERIGRLADERKTLEAQPVAEETEGLAGQIQRAQLQRQQIEVEHKEQLASIEQNRQLRTVIADNLSQARETLQQTLGRRAAAEALQAAALNGDAPRADWIARQGLSSAAQLTEQLRVAEGWEPAVEAVLGDFLQAVCVDDISALAGALDSWDAGKLTLVTAPPIDAVGMNDAARLSGKVAPCALSQVLHDVFVVDTLREALARREALRAGESVVSRDGHWLGTNWLRLTRNDNSVSGVLVRQRELAELETQVEEQQAQVLQFQHDLQHNEASLAQLEQQREALAGQLAGLQQQENELIASLNIANAAIEQARQRAARLINDHDEASAQRDNERLKLVEARGLLEAAITAMAQDSDHREQLLGQRDRCRSELDSARQAARHDHDRVHELTVRERSVGTQLQAIREGIGRLDTQVQRLSERQAGLLANRDREVDPIADLQADLEQKLEQRLAIEQSLQMARQEAEKIEADMRDIEQQRVRHEDAIQESRNKLEQDRISARELQTRCDGLVEQIGELNFELAPLQADMPEAANQDAWQESLTRMENRIHRLGPINLAAVDEYQVEAERKTYLDAQNDELTEALETLEAAIRKIDRETRTKFKETYESINSSLQQLFPKLFGGGHAYLELTGDDLLDTGVTIMAQPPGKKNTTIHLLSGGEKALTAIALVFSIFRLNPAPFCMLDEVDAPLDDANVGRYARMVEEMSETVQFIYITHNKQSMEMAQQLMGVTMHEPGVSRLVAVDVDEAVELAQ